MGDEDFVEDEDFFEEYQEPEVEPEFEIEKEISQEVFEDDNDTNEIVNFSQHLNYENPIYKSANSVNRIINESDFPDYDETKLYNFSASIHDKSSEPCYLLKLNLGTCDCPRFSCACHKSNCAVRWAIKNHPIFSRVLARLSSHASSVKNSINVYKLNISKKAKLRIESLTRWSSSFLMLFNEQVKKAPFQMQNHFR